MVASPKVSVLMGVYNEKEYLREAIESVLGQTYENVQLIIVDDDSTDNSRQIINSYEETQIRLIENETNRGLTHSLNRALEAASGKYVARQDADDISEPNRLNRQVAFLEEHDDVAVVGTGANLIDNQGDIIDRRIGYCNPTYEDFLAKNRLVHGSILARRNIFEHLEGYDEFFRYAQDYELWLRLAKKNRIANIPNPLYNLRLHDQSVYFSHKNDSALYSKFARDLSMDVVDTDTEASVRNQGIHTYWDNLSDIEQALIHQELAIRYLRYGHRKLAIEECQRARFKNGLSIKLLGIIALAYAGHWAVSLTRSIMRQYLNIQTRLHNKFDCPYI